MDCVFAYSDIELLFLVGGFAESAMLQADIRQLFGQRLKIAIPQEASLAILKGIDSLLHRHVGGPAVHFGFYRASIADARY